MLVNSAWTQVVSQFYTDVIIELISVKEARMKGKLIRPMLTLVMVASFLVAAPMSTSAVEVEPGEEDLTPPELVEFS